MDEEEPLDSEFGTLNHLVSQIIVRAHCSGGSRISLCGVLTHWGGGRQPLTQRFTAQMYAKTKELGPIGSHCVETQKLQRTGNYFLSIREAYLYMLDRIIVNFTSCGLDQILTGNNIGSFGISKICICESKLNQIES